MPQALIPTPGAIDFWARFRSNPIAFYLGTCVEAPDPEHDFAYIPVMNDIGGRSKAFQIIQDGEDAIVSMVMNRFDLSVARGIRALHSSAGGGTVNNLGGETPFARGTLVLGTGADFELIFKYRYAGTAAAGNSDLNLGRRYYSCMIEKYGEDTRGNRVLAIKMLIKCENLYIAAGPLAGGFSLYTETDFGALAPII